MCKVDHITISIAPKAMETAISFHTGCFICMERTFAEAFTINLKPIHFRSSAR